MIMKRDNKPRRPMALAALALLILSTAMGAPQAAFADEDKGKGKDGKIPIVIGTPIVTKDPQPKKK